MMASSSSRKSGIEHLFQRSPDLLGVLGADGFFQNANPALLSTLGYTAKELQSRPWIDFVHSEDRSVMTDTLETLTASLTSKGVVHRFRCKDGTFKWLSWKAFTYDGSIFATARDITDLKQLQESLSHSERKLRDLVSHSPFCIHEIDMQGKLLSMNPAGLEMLGISHESEIIGRKYVMLVDKPDRGRVSALMKTAMAGTSEYFDFETIQGDHKKILSSCMIPIRQGSGEVTRIMGITQDITTEKLAQQALLESEEKYRTLIEKAPIGIGLTDMEGTLLDFNEAIRKPGKYSKADLKKIRNVRHLYADPKDRERILDKFRKNGSVEQTEVQFKKRDGSNYFASLSLRPVRVNGKPCLMAIVEDISLRKIAEHNLAQSQRLNNRILETSLDGFILHDQRSNILDANQSYLDMTGYSRDELVGTKMSRRHANLSARQAQLLVSQIIKEGHGRFESVHRKKDGGTIRFEVRSSAIKLNGESYVAGFFRDITERKLVESEMQRSKGLLEMAQSMANLGSFELDYKTDELQWSKEMYRIYEVEPKGVKVTTELAFGVMEPGDRQRAYDYVEALKNGKQQSKSMVYRITTPEGKSKILAGKSKVVFDEKGHPAKLIGTVQDITEQKRAEMGLKESEERLKNIVENVHEAIMLIDPGSNRFVGVNSRAVHLFGYPEKELLKIHPFRLSPKFQEGGVSSRRLMKEKVQEALNGQRPVFEWLHRHAKGGVFESEVRLTKVPYLDQDVVMFSVADITERKAQERERENLINELDRFVYSASHDLSAPLKSLRGLINLAKMDPSEEKKLDYLEKMDASISRLEGFIGDIINYSRNSRLEQTEVNLNAVNLIGEIMENLKFMEGFDRINFRLKAPKSAEIRTDPFRLKIILNNLFSNAIKFHRPNAEPSPFVEIKIKPKETGFSIDVKDNGLGIPLRYQKRIFDMFFRANSFASGSGLGLYIAQETAKRINGILTFQSERGQGSLFRLAVNYKQKNN